MEKRVRLWDRGLGSERVRLVAVLIEHMKSCSNISMPAIRVRARARD